MPGRRRLPAGSRTDLPPLHIIRKILLLQAAYYVCATVLILFTTVVYGTPFSLDLVFGWDYLRGDTTVGWMMGLVWMLNCFIRLVATFRIPRTRDPGDQLKAYTNHCFSKASSSCYSLFRDPNSFLISPSQFISFISLQLPSIPTRSQRTFFGGLFNLLVRL